MAERKKAKSAPEAAEVRPANNTVGETLRATRLAKGLEYEDISVTIHIRPGQLKAIEENDIESLPGMTYAIGFVRSYANFLGLNGAEVVHHFKAEQGHSTTPSKLVFPDPIIESRVPDQMMVGVGVTLAVVMLVGWAVYSNFHGSSKTAEQIPAAPEVASIVPAVPGPDVTAPATGVVAPADATTTTPPAATTAVTPVAPITAAAPVVATAPATAPAAAPVTAVAAPVTAVPATTDNADQEDQTAAEDAPAADRKADDKKSDDGVIKTKDDGVINIKKGKSRITLKAAQDGWVQVIDGNGDVIYKKVLRKGEQYSVPDQPGLSLDTANAGGLTILVDGKAVNAVGGPGEIVRGVILDVKELKARRKPTRGWNGNFRE